MKNTLLWDTQLPRRKSKPKPNPLDRLDSFLQLKAIVMGGKMRPQQQVGILLDEQTGKNLGVKQPWRVAVDRLRRLIKQSGLQSDYHVVKYETDTPGVWLVRVTYEPPMTMEKKRERA